MTTINTIFKNNNNEITMTSLEIAEMTGKQHYNVLRDIEDENSKIADICNALIFELVEYIDQKGEKRKMYRLTKKGIMQLGARCDAKIRYTLIAKLDELERLSKQHAYALPNFNNPIEAARAWADEAEAKKRAIERLEAQRPKIIFADTMQASGKCMLVRDFVKFLEQRGVKTGAVRFYEYLRSNGYLMSHGASWNLPTQRAMELKLFEINSTTITNSKGEIIVRHTPKVTPKGQEYFVVKLVKETRPC